MKTTDIIKHLELQDKNIQYYKSQIEALGNQIEYIKENPKIANPLNLGLDKDYYSKEEIVLAYNKMLRYEGIKEERQGGLIIDTFVEFLNGSHHSEK